jgi:hypothetical protein
MSITCENCGESVALPNADAPLERLERDATESEPKSYLITATDANGSRLLHLCAIVDEKRTGSDLPII